MKSCIKIIFFFLLCTHSAHAQDTAITISPNMFDPNNQILFSTMEGWYFKEGNDTGWAKKEIDMSGWRKLKPIELSAKLADQNGRLEGWLRVKIKLDSAFEMIPLGLRYSGYAASEIYLDGNLIQSNGNMGVNGKPYQEFNPSNNIGNHTEILVTDNGTGIPQKILDKIFQPFFTTKPTGEGTGLGLSIGYDIIQAHGGSLNVKSSESGAEFKIILGVNYA